MSAKIRTSLGSALAVLACAGHVAAQEGDTLVVTLEEAERLALAQSPLLDAAQASLELSRAQERSVRRARILPEINLRNVWGPVPKARAAYSDTGVLFSPDTITHLDDVTFFTQLDLTFVQPVYTFGLSKAAIDAAGHQIELRQAEVSGSEADVLYRTRQLYWGVVLTEALAGVARSLDEQVREADERLQELYDEGDATQNDLFKFQMFQYEVGVQMRELETERVKALSGLHAILGLDEGTALRVSDESLELVDFEVEPLESYVEQALRARPDYRQLEAGIQAREALVRVAEAQGRPTFFVGGGYSMNRSPGRADPRNPFVNNPTNFSRPSIILGFNWNLNFRGNRDRATVERLEAEVLRAQARPLRLLAEQQVREAYLDLVRAREDVEGGEEALRASENLLRAELLVFDVGTGVIDDVISAFEKNVGMSVAQLRNIARFNTKLAELSQRVGRDLSAG